MIATLTKEDKDFLAHYGVLGMKWGVRKQEDGSHAKTGSAADDTTGYDPKNPGKKAVTNRQRKRGIKEGVAFTRRSQVRKSASTRPMTEKEYSKLDSKPVKLGSDFKRVSQEHGKLGSIVYATNNTKDHDKYKAVLLPGNDATADKWDMTLKADKDLVSPSKKQRVDTFIELMGDKVPDESGKVVTGREVLFGENSNHQAIKSLSNREIGLKFYGQFAQSQVAQNHINTLYFDKIKDKGYGAMIDDADAGYLTDTPVVIFPDKSNLKVTEFKPVSEEELYRTRMALKGQ